MIKMENFVFSSRSMKNAKRDLNNAMKKKSSGFEREVKMTVLKENDPNREKRQYWYFTFCQKDRVYRNCFVKFYGTWKEARLEMFRHFGEHWGFQYSSEEFEGQVERFKLEEVVIGKPAGGN